jgi:hypothetical protein
VIARIICAVVSNIGTSTAWPWPVRSRASSAAQITPKAYRPVARSERLSGA